MNKNKSIVLSFTGSLLSLAALLIFMLLPSSELANGIQHSSTDAFWVLAFAPVLSLSGSAGFTYALTKNFKQLEKILPKPAVLCAGAVLCLLMAGSFIVYLSYLIKQFKLGFVAPYGGTVYESLEILVISATVLQFITSALIAVATKKGN